jgi:hypothetical protein
MTRRIAFGMAVGLVALSLGAFQAQAGQVGLPTALSNLETGTGNWATVSGLRFENFQYTTAPNGSPPSADNVTVASFTAIQSEPGITFNGAFHADAGQIVDYAITYMVTSLTGKPIFDAYLSIAGVDLNGGTGKVSVGETIKDLNGNVLSQSGFSVQDPGKSNATTLLTPPTTTIIVQKDIAIFGGSMGATVSFVNQGFSVPEPTSLALLGIGLSGLFSIRRFLKRSAVA